MKRKINKILIANRGEIAVRVIKTCNELGIKTVAVYSEVDRNALHVKRADESYLLGSAPATESYLDKEKILRCAKASGVDAIHPGYGFLSENPDFVEMVEKQGIVFIGPGVEAMRAMGDKTTARHLAKTLGVPIVPGTAEAVTSSDQAMVLAEEITYPILLKAAGGGGGKGMRIVRSEAELDSALKASQSEAASSFADDRVYIEKYLDDPRHIEIQILADSHGNVVHLGERECSIQRRHQKIVEESPSTIVDQNLRRKLTEAAIKLVSASGYRGAGTVEFMVCGDKTFYFLEMNARLQVEHPVTEMRVGIDLVREQIMIARGERLTYTQEDIQFQGHSIECRIYAEDPMNNFYPSIGEIVLLRSPSGFGVREESGLEEGCEVTTYYDPLIAKLIVWGRTREETINRMLNALSSYRIYGIRTNLPLCSWIIDHEEFRRGNIDTNFLTKHWSPKSSPKPPEEIRTAAVIIAALREQSLQKPYASRNHVASKSKWRNKLLEGLR
ncbi:MAG: acetyl-CoA carboxylase biotin carboxylase subunit [Ignavibacteria bacterium]|nr:acetyl-CoA carboxylase biotin carboxylase subunit [Ignavibacteria bacterium]